MPTTREDHSNLSPEWSDVAVQAARNLGLEGSPVTLTPEHWQRVLAAVEARMRMRGVKAPTGWREDLAAMLGRGGDGFDGPES
ncbi:hypothetical protein MEX01_51580 [Methylorubrum extorquens]|nr:hypothetical protein MEX01_51580 [Methylorubrum extorquens]